MMISDWHRLIRRFFCKWRHVMGYETVRDRVFKPCAACEKLIERTVRGEITPEVQSGFPLD